jgi:autotransporter-associated beta strand protein
MKPNSILRHFLALAGSSLMAMSSASAQTNLFWDQDGDTTTATGGTGTWNTSNTWRSGSSTGTLGDWSDGNVAVFGGTAGTVTLSAPVSANGLTFNTTGYAITGSTLTLTGASAPILNVSTGTSTISSDIAGTNGLEKTGSGTLILSGTNNTYSGTTTISAGTLEGQKSITDGASPFGTSTIQLNAGTLNSRTIAPDGTQTFTFGNDVTVGGNATINFSRIGGSGSGKTHAYGNLSIGNNTLTLTSANIGHTLSFTGVNLTGNAIINNNNFAPVNMGAITETGGPRNLTKGGDSVLRLLGVNTYTGDTTINGGTLQIGSNNGALLGGSGGNYTGNISIDSGTLSIASNVNQTLSGIISGAGNLTKENSGTLFLGNSNTYTGKTTISPTTSAGATISIASFNSVVGGTASSSLGAPTTVANGTIDLGNAAAGRGAAITYTGAGETTDRVINFRFNNNGSVHTLSNTGAGLLRFTSAPTSSGDATQNRGGVTLAGNGNGEFSQGLNFNFSNLTKDGNGTWTLGGPVGSGFPTSGVLTVNAGTLALQKKTSLHNGIDTRWTAAKINVKSGATLALNVDSGDVDGLSATSLDTLLTNIYGGTSTSQGLQAGAILGLDTGTATGGSFTQGNAITNSTGTGGGSLGLTKLGTGTLVLDKTNTYTGATNVIAGSLIINGATSSTSAVNVGASGTLGGGGTIGGALAVTGILSPGNSITPADTLTLGSTLTLNANAILAFGLGTTSDVISFSSLADNLTGSGNATLQLSLLSGFSYANTYTIFQNTSTSGFTLSDITGYDDVNYTANFFDGGDSYLLNFTAIPEPGAALLGSIGLIALLRRRR